MQTPDVGLLTKALYIGDYYISAINTNNASITFYHMDIIHMIYKICTSLDPVTFIKYLRIIDLVKRI